MKIFRDMFLLGGVSFDVQALFADKSQDYVWLA